MKGAKGFTLLELLMVVIIIGILAMIAIPLYLKAVERSRAAEALQIIAVVRAAEQRLAQENPGANPYTQDLTAAGPLDVTVANTTNWGFSVSGTALGADVVAGRTAGGATIQIDILNGNICTSNPAVYRFTPLPAGGDCP